MIYVFILLLPLRQLISRHQQLSISQPAPAYDSFSFNFNFEWRESEYAWRIEQKQWSEGKNHIIYSII